MDFMRGRMMIYIRKLTDNELEDYELDYLGEIA
jgi:hypothetical protein